MSRPSCKTSNSSIGEQANIKNRLDYLLANNPAIIYTSRIGGDWAANFVSKNIQGLLGYRSEEFIENPDFLASHIHPDDRERVLRNVEKILEIGFHVHEYRFLRKDGIYVWIHDELRLIRDENGKPVECVGFMIDVSARKKAEEELRRYDLKLQKLVKDRTIELEKANQDLRKAFERLRELETIIDRSPAIAFLWGLTDDMPIEFVSNNITQFGYSPDEVVGKIPYAKFVHPDDLAQVRSEIAECTRKDLDEYPLEYRMLTKTGETRWVYDRTFRRRDSRGTDIGHQGIVVDITERKRAEEALQRVNEKLQLMGSVTRHDALNQLAVLTGRLEIAETTARDDNVLTQLQKIKTAAGTIRRQLEFTADYQQTGVNKPEWISAERAFLSGIMGLSLAQVSLSHKFDDLEVFVDPMFEKVFHNLVDDSLRHGKKVTKINLCCEKSRDGLVIIYEDDGVGIPEEEKVKIFEPGHGKHTGYGLFMARAILGITGLTIEETGIPGNGARFEIHVPFGQYRSDSKRSA